jgi:hypothetical protein
MADRSEKAILNSTLIELSKAFHPDGMFWRNNTGTAWNGEKVRAGVGQMIRVETGMVILRNARIISFGLPGSSDILGCLNGRFVAPETKTRTGAQRETQINFEKAFRRAGGLYILGRSDEEIIEQVRRGA